MLEKPDFPVFPTLRKRCICYGKSVCPSKMSSRMTAATWILDWLAAVCISVHAGLRNYKFRLRLKNFHVSDTVRTLLEALCFWLVCSCVRHCVMASRKFITNWLGEFHQQLGLGLSLNPSVSRQGPKQSHIIETEENVRQASVRSSWGFRQQVLQWPHYNSENHYWTVDWVEFSAVLLLGLILVSHRRYEQDKTALSCSLVLQ